MKTIGEKCEPNIRWNNGELQQLWAIIEYRDDREYERSWQWRDVPGIKDDPGRIVPMHGSGPDDQ